MDLIDRQAAIDAMCELMHHWFGGDPKDEMREINRELGKLPSVQPKQGKNIYNTVHGHCEFKCSVCGAEAHIVEGGELDGGYFNYCPNCGAEMEPERKINGLV